METKEITVKEYLSQAKFLDQRINSKIQQVAALNDLATKATSTLTGMPRNPNHATSSMEDVIAKIIDLQAEINNDIDTLVDLKRSLSKTIKAVDSREYQTVLDKRYLCFQSWEQIAVEMGYELRWLYRIHGKALEEVKAILGIE